MDRTRPGEGASRRELANTKELDGSQGLRGSGQLLPPACRLFRGNCSSYPSSDTEIPTVRLQGRTTRSIRKFEILLSYRAGLVAEWRYVLDSDASEEALSLVLQQEQDGMLKVIAYASLQPAERSYCTTRKELLAVIYGLKHC